VEAVVGDVAGHGGERAEGIDGIEVAEQEDRRSVFSTRFAAGEIDLHAVAVVGSGVDLQVSAEGFEISGEEGAHAVGGGLVVAGRFDLDELADGLDDFFLAEFEVVEALGPRRGGVCGGGGGRAGPDWFRTSWFFDRHFSAVLRRCVRRWYSFVLTTVVFLARSLAPPEERLRSG
jgi:hypothetical protein